jgi:hypothetical protein
MHNASTVGNEKQQLQAHTFNRNNTYKSENHVQWTFVGILERTMPQKITRDLRFHLICIHYHLELNNYVYNNIKKISNLVNQTYTTINIWIVI